MKNGEWKEQIVLLSKTSFMVYEEKIHKYTNHFWDFKHSCLQEIKAFKTNDSESYLFLNMSQYKKEDVKQGSKRYCTAQLC